MFVFRVESSLVYFNVEHVRDRFFELLSARGGGVQPGRLLPRLLSRASTSPAPSCSRSSTTRCARGGSRFRLAEARGEVRETLRRAGFEQHGAPVVANQPVATVISEWRDRA